MGKAADFIDGYPENPNVAQARDIIWLAFQKELDNSLAEKNYGRILILWNGFPLVRQRYGAVDPRLRYALAEAMDCRFCSQSRHNHTPIDVFPLLPDEELRERILHLAKLPVARIGVVTSGSALNGGELSRLRNVIAGLPDAVRPRLCASLGKLTADDFSRLAASGLTRFHHNLETSQRYYPSVCTTQT